VLLLHGWGSHAARFGSFVEPMLEAGWRVIAASAAPSSSVLRNALGYMIAPLQAGMHPVVRSAAPC
jgi:hypothetical protein